MNIQLENVGRCFGDQWAVRNVGTEIPAGTMTAVLGANGAGKSTLLRLIAGWLPVATGRVTVGDRLVKPTRLIARRQVMLVDDPPRGDRNVVESIGTVITDYEVDRPEIESEVADWFSRLDLIGVFSKTASSVSKGQGYKVLLTGLFVVRPHVWLLDEPFSCGLDAGGLLILEDEMKSHVASGGIVIFSTQWPEHAKRLADRCLVMHQGNLVRDADVDEPVDPESLQQGDDSLRAVLMGLSGHA